MLPFCGYNMSDYFAYWLQIGRDHDPATLPRFFYVNWFRKAADGHWLWPGFGENSRVLEWVYRRCEGTAAAVDTPIGRLPAPADLNTAGLELAQADLAELLRVDTDGWTAELASLREHFQRFGDRLPGELNAQLEALAERLAR
jgi:phosphoenolpyruvate carboxykinase (GTP)